MSDADLSTDDAAESLNVCLSYFFEVLEQGAIPFHQIGTHRRVRFQYVIAYKERVDADRRKALEALTEQAQALQMGYE